jgi:hypothetical protein
LCFDIDHDAGFEFQGEVAEENGDLTDEFSDQAIIKFCVIKSDTMPAAEEYFIGELIFQCPDDSGDTQLHILPIPFTAICAIAVWLISKITCRRAKKPMAF